MPLFQTRSLKGLAPGDRCGWAARGRLKGGGWEGSGDSDPAREGLRVGGEWVMEIAHPCHHLNPVDSPPLPSLTMTLTLHLDDQGNTEMNTANPCPSFMESLPWRPNTDPRSGEALANPERERHTGWLKHWPQELRKAESNSLEKILIPLRCLCPPPPPDISFWDHWFPFLPRSKSLLGHCGQVSSVQTVPCDQG